MRRESGPTDRVRLARVFGFEPVKPWGALVGAGVLVLIPWGTWIAGGAIAVAITAMVVDENRRIADSLREVEAWGFPVEGYRAWLLASSPAFDLELSQDVPVDLVAGSCAAVDKSIMVERRGERIVRVIMARIEMEGGEGQPAVQVGDRTRLRELHDRVLAPLHADVGIVAMRMGDRTSLAALVAGAGGVKEAAFREQARVAPPDLQSLVHAGTSQLAPPQEAQSLKLRTDRLLYATGHVPVSSGAMMWAVVGGVIIGGVAGATAGIGAALGILLGSGAGSLAAWGQRRGDHRKLAAVLGFAGTLPFPVTGYDNWLLSGRPMFDVELGAPAEPHVVEQRFRAVKQGLRLTWLRPDLLRVESDAVLHMAAQGIKSFYGGSAPQFELIARQVLLELAETTGIRAVRMGGYVDRRV